MQPSSSSVDPASGGSAAVESEGVSSALEMRRTILQRRSEPLYYASYLRVPELLSLQHPKSDESGAPAHDEMLFVIVHQAYELWFKQILHELDSVRRLFGSGGSGGAHVADRDMGVAVSRLERVRSIQTLMLQQIDVLETMSPLDFLSFRDFLYPASGFQSVQFRRMENCLGLRSQQRLSYGGRTGYCSVLSAEDAAAVADSEQPPSLFQLMEEWLERTPFLEFQAELPQGSAGSAGSAGSSPPSSPPLFTFWGHYRTAVEAMLEADGMLMRANSSAFTPAALEAHARDLAAQRAHFDSLLDPAMYAASLERGERRLSHRATQAALMITLFQREPGFAQPYRFLQALLSIDEALCAWRARHAQMVHRMLGAKVGTGGSSGYSYLKATVDRHRIFTDLFNLSTFLIPEAMLPPLPPELTQRLGFNFPPSSAAAAAAPRAAASASRAAAAAPHPVPQVGTPPGVCPFGHSSN